MRRKKISDVQLDVRALAVCEQLGWQYLDEIRPGMLQGRKVREHVITKLKEEE